MVHFVVLYRQPADPEAFERAYWDTHVPLAKQIPHLAGMEVVKFWPGKDGPTKFYQMATLKFADKESFKAAMKSAENAAAGANLMSFAADIIEFYTAETV
ncbi:EthD family reductase [candidate division KSB1 bacterium]|nr:EthD family reductase [candidate division KSB1 bacterium]